MRWRSPTVFRASHRSRAPGEGDGWCCKGRLKYKAVAMAKVFIMQKHLQGMVWMA